MKEHLQDDNFEEFLRNKLNEFDDEPSDNMWDRVEGVIPPAPKPMLFRIMKPSAIAASVVLAIAVIAAVYHYTTKQNLNEQLIEATDKIKELENKIERETAHEETAQLEEVQNNEKQIEENALQQENNLINQNKSSNVGTTSNNKTTNKNSNKSNSSTNYSNQLKHNQNNKNNKLSNNPSNVIDNSKERPIANDKKNKQPQKQLNKNELDKTPIANDNKTTEPFDKNINNKTQNPFIEPNKEDAIVFGEPFLLDRKRNNAIDNYAYFIMVEPSSLKKGQSIVSPPQLIVGGFVNSFQTRPEFKERSGPPAPGGNPFNKHRVKPATGLAIGATVGLQFNQNWSIHSGLAYQQEKVKMRLIDNLDYQKDRETDIGNNRQSYRANYITHSPFGEVSVSGAFTKDKDDNIEDKPFDIEIDGTHQLKSFNIPLYLQAQNKIGRFVYGVKGGVNVRNTFMNAFEATEITSSISELKASEIVIVEQPEISNKWTADFLYGAVLAYQHNKDVVFSLEPTSLMSIGEKHKSPYGNTRLKSFGVQFGAKYIF